MKFRPNEDVLKIGSTYARHALKKRILKQKLLNYKCSICENPGEWQGKKLSLQLDHINGVQNDNRLENLRFICPNCHSQTETYAGKNSKGMRRPDDKAIVNYRRDKKLKDSMLWEEIKQDGTIDFIKYGWKRKVAERIKISSQKVMQWIQRVDPQFLVNVK